MTCVCLPLCCMWAQIRSKILVMIFFCSKSLQITVYKYLIVARFVQQSLTYRVLAAGIPRESQENEAAKHEAV